MGGKAMRPLRIGRIAFTNVLPIYHYFEADGLPVELVPMVPSQLNRLMAAGEIDMGPISSFAYAEKYPNFVLLPDLSVSARGRVGSIFLFTRDAALSDLRSAKIALTNTSASSVALLKVLLNGFERGNPEYVTMPPSLGDMMEQADAALLIGDDAIRAQWENPGYRVFDLGWEWYQRTGLDMVFAVWAVRREVVEERPDELYAVYERFFASKERSRLDPTPVIREAQRQLGGDEAFWRNYYNGLCYDLRQPQLEGLEAYYRRAAEIGLLSPSVRIEVLDLPAGTSTGEPR
jgi:chorismate dehydratase